MIKRKTKKSSLKEICSISYELNEITKAEIKDETGLSLTAVSNYINQLTEVGWLVSGEKATSSGGRRPQKYYFNGNFKYIIGIDIRQKGYYIFLSNLRAKVIIHEIVEMSDNNYKNYLKNIYERISKIFSQTIVEKNDILAVGISISGITDFANKVVNRSNQLNWNEKKLADDMEKLISLPVFVETDSRVYACNELEKNNEKNTAVVLYLSTGIGLALITNNKILEGYTNRAGDNRFFGTEIKELVKILKEDKYIKEVNNYPYYAGSFPAHREDKIRELNKNFEEYIEYNNENKLAIEKMIDLLSEMIIATISLLNPGKILLTGNIFDYNDYIYHSIKDKIISTEDVFYIPDIKRNSKEDNPLERALARFIMHKFFYLEEFNIDGSYVYA